MNDTEKVQSFCDMVNATEKLTKPWRIALLVTNLLWALVFAAFILLAYLTPDTSYQMQDFTGRAKYRQPGLKLSRRVTEFGKTSPSA